MCQEKAVFGVFSMSGFPVEPLLEGSVAACCSSLRMLKVRVRIMKELRRLFILAKVGIKCPERGLVIHELTGPISS